MSLIDANELVAETWTACLPRAVELAFLRAERDKWAALTTMCDRRLITQPDLADAKQNSVRAHSLWRVRGPLLEQIPTDTEWFEVKHLRGHHFQQLLAINHPHWTSSSDMNELEKVALRKPLSFTDLRRVGSRFCRGTIGQARSRFSRVITD